MTLGSTIRDAREAARISISSLSESTSIRMGLLTEMEDDNFKHCGGDTYARGHLRNIANRIGLNPQILLDLYNEEHSTEKRAMQDLLVENNIMQVPREKKTISWKVPALISVTKSIRQRSERCKIFLSKITLCRYPVRRRQSLGKFQL